MEKCIQYNRLVKHCKYIYLVVCCTDRNLVFRWTLTTGKHKRNSSEWSTPMANNNGAALSLVEKTPSSSVIL